jgi:NADH dehydrogenase
VTALVPGAGEIRTDDGQVLRYDRLVYALGSRTAGTGTWAGTGASAGAASAGHVFTPESAGELHKRLLDGPGSLAVAGGGLTGCPGGRSSPAGPRQRSRSR